MEASNKRQKTKGKEIIEEEEEEEEEETHQTLAGNDDPTADTTCGICLSDVGVSIRGRIDSCSHYFCFICIMEWSKVETRCPLCKLRFGSIRRPSVKGIFEAERVVHVPERNQVYNGYGNGSIAPSDPYVNTLCIKCRTAENEELLLLCDLCDSASHTYCVGLGATVPEGDWYCCDCARIRDEHSRIQSDSDGCNQDSYDRLRAARTSAPVPTYGNSSNGIMSHAPYGSSSEPGHEQQVDNDYIPQLIQIVDGHSRPQTHPDVLRVTEASEMPVSIFEIVSDPSQGFSDPAVRQQVDNGAIPRTTRRRSQAHVDSSSEIVPSTDARGEQHVRTLQHCRNVQGHIRQIRENWNAIRSGSLRFSFTNTGSNNRSYNMKKKNKLNSDTLRQTESISSIGADQHADASASSKNNSNKGPQDVDRAWKMMKMAKSMEGNLKRTAQSHSSNISRKGNTSKDVRNHKHHPLSTNCSTPSRSVAVGTAFRIAEVQPNYPIHGKEKSTSFTEKELFHKGETTVPLSFQRVPDAELSASKGSDSPNWKDSATALLSVDPNLPFCSTVDSKDEKLPAARLTNKTSTRNTDTTNCTAKDEMGSVSLNCKGSKTALLSIDPNLPSCSKIDSQDEKLLPSRRTHKTSTRKTDTTNCSAKDEIQSLVKLNLKLQSRNQRLDADTFKEVARVATHTILAACGLEHSKSSVRVKLAPRCKHTQQFGEIRKSNIMPNCCRDCFYSFVKDVVNSIFLEKTAL